MSTGHLLKLPNELLLGVLDCFDRKERQAVLCRLSLVNRRLAEVARDELFVSPSINPMHAKEMVAQLVRNPCLASKIRWLEIQHNCAVEERDSGGILTADMYQKRVKPLSLRCLQTLRMYRVTEVASGWVPWLDTDDAFIYSAVVIVMAQGLKQLCLSRQFADMLGRAEITTQPGGSFRPYLTSPILWGQRFRSLDSLIIGPMEQANMTKIEPNSENYLRGLRYMDFGTFQNVLRLEVPGEILAIIHQTKRPTNIGKEPGTRRLNFPSAMEYLCITECIWRYLRILHELSHPRIRHEGNPTETRVSRAYPHLREVVVVWNHDAVPEMHNLADEHAVYTWHRHCQTAVREGYKLRWTAPNGLLDAFEARRLSKSIEVALDRVGQIV
ncbi:hypothetical protein EK21DRAFT_90065 [Setomelanomma holmii]|uniref:F-box domain-containing protein n=1 Tax=Setomelanomma holmii TaxID=210430 RepID=A0A9P4H6P1_9PLEO|nr:hypothetical protein EK21DRAFT_90065 [Setomelanomma holmii]